MDNDFYNAGSFAPIVSDQSQILIVGTMPGITSLKKQEYYGHPQNLFWPFLFRIFQEPFSTTYKDRIQFILDKKLALWDTLELCEREGSLDTNIKNESPNDIRGLIKQYSSVHTVVCNGKSAEKYFRKYHKDVQTNILGMPSTSPANASIPKETKFEMWAGLKKHIILTK